MHVSTNSEWIEYHIECEVLSISSVSVSLFNKCQVKSASCSCYFFLCSPFILSFMCTMLCSVFVWFVAGCDLTVLGWMVDLVFGLFCNILVFTPLVLDLLAQSHCVMAQCLWYGKSAHFFHSLCAVQSKVNLIVLKWGSILGLQAHKTNQTPGRVLVTTTQHSGLTPLYILWELSPQICELHSDSNWSTTTLGYDVIDCSCCHSNFMLIFCSRHWPVTQRIECSVKQINTK